ncbi:MAG: DUF2298 domain-containing protein [Gammaproteobacteria bacterium]|nr:DUF2298 domain-containing protein [Gammaproteobacteria bacterium]
MPDSEAMELVLALLFFAWYEVLTLPLRIALGGTPLPPDTQRVLSRLAGPLVFTLPIFYIAHITEWALNAAVGIGWIVLLFAAALFLLKVRQPQNKTAVALGYRSDAKTGVGVLHHAILDGVTLALFLAFIWLRQWIPEMTTYVIDSSAAEKFMNSMIFWTNWYATSLPPEDYWLAGHQLSYYYWGHFFWAWVGRIGEFPAELALNLALARLVTLVFEAGYLLGRTVGLKLSWSVLAGLMVAWAGNPSAVEELWKVYQSSAQGFNWGAYNFWGPSRAIADSVIAEFPAFTAILGDFHAHHLALPWLVAWFAVTLFALTRSNGLFVDTNTSGRFSTRLYFGTVWVIVWFTLGLSSCLTNLWNLPAIGFICVVAACYSVISKHQYRWFYLLLTVALILSMWLTSSLILGDEAQPLILSDADSIWQRLPIKWLPAELRSSSGQLFSMWGLPVSVLTIAAVTRAVLRRDRVIVALMSLGVGLLVLSASSISPILPGGSAWIWIAVAILSMSLYVGSDAWLNGRCVSILLCAYTTLAALELIYVNDAFTGEYVRYNSYFKFSYPVWPALTVGAIVAGQYLWRNGDRGSASVLRITVRSCALVVLVAALIYPTFAIPARLLAAWRGDDPPRQATLNAVDFIAHRPPYREEAEMLAWIREHVPPGQVVAEGQGRGAYGYTGRVASLAGRPVPLGWAHHEGQWRGAIGHRLTSERQSALNQLYLAATPQGIRGQARKLGAQWVLYGIVERESYGKGITGIDVPQRLREAAPVAAAFPLQQPAVFLFDLREQEAR